MLAPQTWRSTISREVINGGRARISDDGNYLVIVIRPRKKGTTIALVAAIIPFIMVVALADGYDAATAEKFPWSGAVLVVIFLLLDILLIYFWLYWLFGREVIRAGEGALSIRRGVFGRGRTRTYQALQIEDLRYVSTEEELGAMAQRAGMDAAMDKERDRGKGPAGPTPSGALIFLYYGRKVRFASDLGAAAAEAKEIERLVRERAGIKNVAAG